MHQMSSQVPSKVPIFSSSLSSQASSRLIGRLPRVFDTLPIRSRSYTGLTDLTGLTALTERGQVLLRNKYQKFDQNLLSAKPLRFIVEAGKANDSWKRDTRLNVDMEHSTTDRNTLGEATSPYLRQHADNPVHWQQWSPATLAQAKARNLPILLSIGYAACHVRLR